jgi:DNA-binding NtrC family response regulator
MADPILRGLSLLIVEDEPLVRKQVAAFAESAGAEVTALDSIEKCRRMLGSFNYDFALLDVNLPDGLGTDLLRDKAFPETTGIIIMTAEGGVSGAVEAMRLGALDYLVKPFDPAQLLIAINRVRRNQQSARLTEHARAAAGQPEGSFYFGFSLAPVQGILEKILAADRRLQDHLPPVLIQGQTGTGKTTIARWLHQQGPRSAQALVEINCSALPESLAESELFGHERGAFTDARAARLGLFEAASGGTLFLDELPSLSPPLQAKVLKAIEDGRIRRVGGTKELLVDVRIIAATNRDLRESVAKGEFREDLYHRLDLYRICLPALSERGEDIARLAEVLLAGINKRHRTHKSIHAEGLKKLLAYPWPGNVRELAHEIERAVVFEESDALKFEALSGPGAAAAGVAISGSDWFNERFQFPEQGFVLDEAINRVIQHALKQSEGNVSAAARLLGVTRDFVRYRLQNGKSPV